MKPRVRLLRRDGDATKVVVTLFSKSGSPVRERLVMLSSLQAMLSGDSWRELAHNVTKAIKEHNRELDMGYWP